MITSVINSPEDLITSRDRTRSGFIAMALEKNYLALPYVEEAKALKLMASKVNSPIELLNAPELRVGLITASGLSEKSLNYLNEEDRTLAIQGLIKEFLEPAGDGFIDELVYRYLLTKGDALGGKARNLAGTLGERKFLRTLISVFAIAGIDFKWKDSKTGAWIDNTGDTADIEKRINGLFWYHDYRPRLMVLNVTVPVIKKNVDICVLEGMPSDFKKGKDSIIYLSERYLALGELKGGIDPAGADEHWKTANSALLRIRKGFETINHTPFTFFIGAAIERSMANEIYSELQTGVMTKAANLSSDEQLTEICSWISTL